MFTNQLSWLRHANVDFDKKEPDIRVPGNNARDMANATAHLYTRYTFARAGGSRGVSRNSSSSSNDDVNPRPIHLFWLLYSTPKSGFSLLSFLFHSYDFRGCISRWINELPLQCCSLLHISLKISIVSDSQLSRRPKKHKKEKERERVARYCRV